VLPVGDGPVGAKYSTEFLTISSNPIVIRVSVNVVALILYSSLLNNLPTFIRHLLPSFFIVLITISNCNTQTSTLTS